MPTQPRGQTGAPRTQTRNRRPQPPQNGTRIGEFVTTTHAPGNRLRGQAADVVMLDEAAHFVGDETEELEAPNPDAPLLPWTDPAWRTEEQGRDEATRIRWTEMVVDWAGLTENDIMELRRQDVINHFNLGVTPLGFRDAVNTAIHIGREVNNVPVRPENIPYSEAIAGKIADRLLPMYVSQMLDADKMRLINTQTTPLMKSLERSLELLKKIAELTGVTEYKAQRDLLIRELKDIHTKATYVENNLYKPTNTAVDRPETLKVPRQMSRDYLMKEVKALWDKFGRVDYVKEYRKEYISCWTEDCHVEYFEGDTKWEIVVGPFEIRFVIAGEEFADTFNGINSERSNNGRFKIYTTKPERNSLKSGYIHPHVREGIPCLGNDRQGIRASLPAAMNTGMLFMGFNLMDNLLHNYNDEGPHFDGSIKMWGNRVCPLCETAVPAARTRKCFTCEAAYCDTCTQECGDCHRFFCKACGKRDPANPRAPRTCPCRGASVVCKGCEQKFDTNNPKTKIHGYNPATGIQDPTKTGYCPTCLSIWGLSNPVPRLRTKVTPQMYKEYQEKMARRTGARNTGGQTTDTPVGNVVPAAAMTVAAEVPERHVLTHEEEWAIGDDGFARRNRPVAPHAIVPAIPPATPQRVRTPQRFETLQELVAADRRVRAENARPADLVFDAQGLLHATLEEARARAEITAEEADAIVAEAFARTAANPPVAAEVGLPDDLLEGPFQAETLTRGQVTAQELLAEMEEVVDAQLNPTQQALVDAVNPNWPTDVPVGADIVRPGRYRLNGEWHNR